MNVPIEVSNRHAHLSKEDIVSLFGENYELKKLKELSQPGEFAAGETVTIVNGERKIENVRVLGPPRDKSQVEISLTDSNNIKMEVPLRVSGDTEGAPLVKMLGPNGEAMASMIIAKRHLHLSPQEADDAGVKDKDIVKVRVDGERAVVFENVLVRVGQKFKSAVHLDRDEGNSAGIKGAVSGEIVK